MDKIYSSRNGVRTYEIFRDDHKALKCWIKGIPEDHRNEALTTFQQSSNTYSGYIGMTFQAGEKIKIVSACADNSYHIFGFR